MRSTASYETVARRRSAALLSEFGLGHVREYAPFDLILGALHLILRAKSLIIYQAGLIRDAPEKTFAKWSFAEKAVLFRQGLCRMPQMQGTESEGEGSVLTHMTKPESRK